MGTERARLRADGNCGFALLGRDIQEREAEFVEVKRSATETQADAERRATTEAYSRKATVGLSHERGLAMVPVSRHTGRPRR